MIREDNIALETLLEDLKTDRIELKEYVTRSEGAALFTVALNKELLNNYKSFDKVIDKVAKIVTIGDGQGSDIKFPNMWGVNPAYVPELSEIPFTNGDISSVTVEPDKFAIRAGISQEMIDDNECQLLSWTIGMVGTKMAELEDEEGLKALHTYSNAAHAVDTSLGTHKGRFDRGVDYLTGTCTNTLSASALGWEEILNTGMTIMRGQTVSLLGETYRYPVYPTTLLVHTSREISVRKVLNATTVVGATGINVSPTSVGGAQLAGSPNVMRNFVNLVATPYQATRTGWLMDPARGSFVFIRRKTPQIDKNANWAFDAQEVRARSRFRGAVVEEKGLLPILY